MLAKIKEMVRAIEERDEDATKLDNNLNGDVNANPEATSTKFTLEDDEELMLARIRGLPIEAQEYAAKSYGEFKNELKEFLNSHSDGTVIDKDAVDNFFKRL
jgi:hypothetical protein